MRKPSMPEDVLKFFRKTGAEGGRARAMKYTKNELSEMGKKGGRPPKKDTAKPTKGAN